MPGCGRCVPVASRDRALRRSPTDIVTSNVSSRPSFGWPRGATSHGRGTPRSSPRRPGRATNACGRRDGRRTSAAGRRSAPRRDRREAARLHPSADALRRRRRRPCGTGRRRAAEGRALARPRAAARSTTARASASERTMTASAGSGPGAPHAWPFSIVMHLSGSSPSSSSPSTTDDAAITPRKQRSAAWFAPSRWPRSARRRRPGAAGR